MKELEGLFEVAGETSPADFEAGAEARSAPPSFKAAVQEAFAVEHGCLRDRDIMAVTGLTKGRVSQILNSPRTLKEETVLRLLSHVRSPVLRRGIAEAWRRARDGEATVPELPIPSPNALRQVASLQASGRPDRALALAREALSGDPDAATRRYLLMQAVGLSLRLDEAGEAMALAARLHGWGKEERSPMRMAEGLAVSARVMRRSGLPNEARSARREALDILAALPGGGRGRNADEAFARDLVESEQSADVLQTHRERGGGEESLAVLLALASRRFKEATNPAGRMKAKQLESLAFLALGKPFEAEEALAAAFEAGGGNPAARLACGPIEGRVLAARGNTEQAVEHYRKLALACERSRHVFLYRLCQTELARLTRPAR